MTSEKPGEPTTPSIGRRISATVTSADFWLGPFSVAIGSLVALALAVAFYTYGGLPHDFDRYGIVGVPGSAVTTLPAGFVMLDHVDDVHGCYDNTSHIPNASIPVAPDGLAVRVVPVGGGEALHVTSIPDWLYESDVACRGHTPFGRIDVPVAGRYTVQTTDARSGDFATAAGGPGTTSGDPTIGPGIAFGPAPWTPFGSRALGAALVILLVVGVSLAPRTISRRLWPRVTAWLAARKLATKHG